MTTISPTQNSVSPRRLYLLVVVLIVLWFVAYNTIQPLANWLAYTAIGLSTESHLGEALAFFLYDVPKILLLLSGMVFLISIIRTFFSPERTRALLGGKREGIGNVLGALLGIVTPFCSCSAVPLFIGFVEAGIPLGVTFSFLIAAPTINEIAVVMLFGLFGWKIAGLYIASGLFVAIAAGFLIGRFKMERFVETDLAEAHLASLGISQGNRREGVAVRGGWDRHRRRHSRVRARGCVSVNYGQAGLVVGARCGGTRSAAVFQRSWHHPGGQRLDGKRRLTWDGVDLHDVGGRPEPARSGHPAARLENAVIDHLL
jgi:uncharacterized membrane protein YraQ (UPF0718 family)